MARRAVAGSRCAGWSSARPGTPAATTPFPLNPMAPRRSPGRGARSPPLLDWLYTAISWVLARWHSLFDLLFGNPPPESGLAGLAWSLSIVFLVVTIRLLLFPLFVKQV